jgi:hypothetical protein
LVEEIREVVLLGPARLYEMLREQAAADENQVKAP